MDAYTLFVKANNTFNTWYKFINSDKYNEEAYELFEKSKNKYIMDKKYDDSVKCYISMIQCLKLLSYKEDYELLKIYEEIGDLLIKKNILILL